MSNTNHIFIPGKITYLLDSSSGSSAKGKITSFLIKNQSIKPFLCTTNSRNASHVVMDGNKKIVFKVLPSGAYLTNKITDIFIGPGATFKVEDLFEEIEICGLDKSRIKIHPTCSIIQEIDEKYERGECGFDGEYFIHDGTIKTGTTASGAGSARARKVMRRPSALYAKDVPELQEMICDITIEIVKRLNEGKCGFHDICQGFQLSLSHPLMAPYTTARNVSVSAALDDMLLPPNVVGNVIINCRTYPIRIHSKKYVSKAESIDYIKMDENGMVLIPEKYQDKRLYDVVNDENKGAFVSSVSGVHITWDEKESKEIPFEIIESYSGPFYEDQEEITWEELTERSGSETPLFECTTLTKLPRRVFTFSAKNLEEAILYNNTGHKTFVTVTFADYVDIDMKDQNEVITNKFMKWINKNITPSIEQNSQISLLCVSTGPQTDATVMFPN